MMRKSIAFMGKLALCPLVALAQPASPDHVNGGATDVTVSIDASKPKWTISKYLTGSHFVYGHEPDAVYRDNPEILKWMKDAKVGILRWPGGTVTMSTHWNDLTGYSFPFHVKQLTGKEQPYDSWHPKYNLPRRDPSQFMDMDEFIAICREVGAEPCIGVNILSGRKYRTEADSHAEARAQIQYCVDKGYNVKFWYIGNEPYAKGFTAEQYVKAIDTYARILRSVDPDITIIGDWKYGPERKNRFQHCLKIVEKSEELDILEVHEKWGNPWGVPSGQTASDWMKEAPYLYNGQLTDFTNRIVDFAKEVGKPGLQVGYNEWGLGDPKSEDGKRLDHHRMGLLGADFLIEIFRAPIATACYWNLNMGDPQTRIFTVNDDGTVTMNPIRHPFVMVAQAMSEKLLEVESSENSVYGFASRAGQSVQVFLLNKSDKPATATFAISGGNVGKILDMESYVAPGVVKTIKPSGAPVTLPALSFTRIRFEVILRDG